MDARPVVKRAHRLHTHVAMSVSTRTSTYTTTDWNRQLPQLPKENLTQKWTCLIMRILQDVLHQTESCRLCQVPCRHPHGTGVSFETILMAPPQAALPAATGLPRPIMDEEPLRHQDPRLRRYLMCHQPHPTTEVGEIVNLIRRKISTMDMTLAETFSSRETISAQRETVSSERGT